jgi:DNA-binding response OmpR family regulator
MKSALIVEKDAAVRLVLLRSLGRHGWWVDATDGMEAALALLDKAPRDVALIDWQADNGAGLALLAAIKMDPVWHAMPVIMMHRGATLAEVERAFELGANDFLPKPFTGGEALEKLGRWVIDRAGPPERELVG